MNKQQRLKNIIQEIIVDTNLHARWINTFSFLEYIGFRKILKSQPADSVNLAVLTHAVEEGRHSLRLKKLAVKMGGPGFDNFTEETLFCGREAENYFQALDKYVENSFGSELRNRCAILTYNYVTWLVEVRALDVYNTYKAVLAHSEIAKYLDSLLKEEENHLDFVQQQMKTFDPEMKSRIIALQEYEQQLFEELLSSMKSELGKFASTFPQNKQTSNTVISNYA